MMCVYITAQSNGQWSYYIMCSLVNTNIDWWLFDKTTAVGGNIGLEAYDASGQIIYTALSKPMIISAEVNNNTQLTTYNPVSGRTYAGVQGNLAGTRTYMPSGNQGTFRQVSNWIAMGSSSTGGGIRIGSTRLDQVTATTTNPGPDITYNQSHHYIIDITGY